MEAIAAFSNHEKGKDMRMKRLRHLSIPLTALMAIAFLTACGNVPAADPGVSSVSTPAITANDAAIPETTPTPSASAEEKSADSSHGGSRGSQTTAPPYDWIDPTTTPVEGTLYALYDTPSRGKDKQGSFLIHLPASYNTDNTRKYPVIYWLHGGFGYQSEIAKALPYYLEAMQSGKMPEVILVAPQALPSGWYANSKDGSRLVEDVIINDLIPYIDATYRTISDASGRGIEGMSMGGYGSLRLGLKHPDVFGAISAVGPSIRKTLAEEPAIRTEDTFFGDQDFYAATGPWGLAVSNNASILAAQPDIRVLGGTMDDLEPVIVEFEGLLTSLKIQHEFAEAEGAGHEYTDILDKLTLDPHAFWKTAFSN